METCKVMLKTDQTRIGYAVDSSLLAIPDSSAPSGLRYQHMICVGWLKVGADNNLEISHEDPAFLMHDPSELTFLGLAIEEDLEDGTSDEEEIFDIDDSDQIDIPNDEQSTLTN